MPKKLHERHNSGEQRHFDNVAQHPDYFFIRKSGLSTLTRISCLELIYVQSDWNYVVLTVASKQRHLVHQSLKSMAAYLDCFGFVQVHKRYLINLQKIHEIKPKHVLMCDGTEIPIGRHYRKRFLERVAAMKV